MMTIHSWIGIWIALATVFLFLGFFGLRIRGELDGWAHSAAVAASMASGGVVIYALLAINVLYQLD